MVGATLVDGSLNDGFEAILIVVGEGGEAEWLQAPGKRAQHLRRAEHHARVCQKHQFSLTAGVDRTSHGEQAPSQGDDFQFSGNTAAVVESKDGGSTLGKIHSRSPRSRV